MPVRYKTFVPSGEAAPVTVEEATRLFADQIETERLKTKVALALAVGMTGAFLYRTWRCRQDVTTAETETLRSVVRSTTGMGRRGGYYGD